MMTPEIKVLPDPAAVAAEAAQRFVQLAELAIRERDRFSVALSGGSTPKAMHALLAAEPLRSRVDWAKVEIYFGDERCVPPDHPDSNYRMARETLLSNLPIADENVHRMRGEIEPEAAAKEYGQMLKAKFGDSDSPDAGLDLVYLGMGDDGHTASLFAGSPAVRETKHRVVANYSDHTTTGKSWRITMTAPFINRSRNVIVLVTGAGKAQRLAEVLEGPRDPDRLPIQLIAPTSAQLTWLIDAAAASMDA